MKKMTLITIFTFLVTLCWVGLALAADGPKTPHPGGWGIGIGAGLAIGLAAFGGGFGQGKAASAFLDGVARNPKARGEVFLGLILALAFVETLVIFAFVIANSLVGKL